MSFGKGEKGLADLAAAGGSPADLLRVRQLLDEAVGLLASAGGRALTTGQSGSAADLLGRACDLLEVDHVSVGGTARYADLLEARLTALVQAGRLKDAGALAGPVEELDCAGLGAERVAALRTRLAWAACVAGNLSEGAAQLLAAQEAVPASRHARCHAALNAVAGRLASESAGGDGIAAVLGRRALALAVRQGLPEDACRAWEVLGLVARQRSIGESAACFERMGALAREHGLAYWRLLADLQLGTDECRAQGDRARLEQVLRVAPRMGAAAVNCSATAVIALDDVLRARYAEAGELLDRCWAEAGLLGLEGTLRSLSVVRAVLAGQQGKRQAMEEAWGDFRQRGGDSSRQLPPAVGLARVFCALLEEDRERALVELDRAAVHEPAGHPLAGARGLGVLLAVLPDGGRQVAVHTGQDVRWNRQFVWFAHAVQLGRQGRTMQALDAVAVADSAAEPYPMARHLGLRLVAEAAYRDGWGHPADWLRAAEEYFHAASVPAVAGAARSLLRRIGVPPRQRREGAEAIPPALRRLGVTVREFEVLRLVVNRYGNKAIAERLYISHRTVEKHVGSLLMKLGYASRGELSDRAALLLAAPAGEGPA